MSRAQKRRAAFAASALSDIMHFVEHPSPVKPRVVLLHYRTHFVSAHPPTRLAALISGVHPQDQKLVPSDSGFLAESRVRR